MVPLGTYIYEFTSPQKNKLNYMNSMIIKKKKVRNKGNNAKNIDAMSEKGAYTLYIVYAAFTDAGFDLFYHNM